MSPFAFSVDPAVLASNAIVSISKCIVKPVRSSPLPVKKAVVHCNALKLPPGIETPLALKSVGVVRIGTKEPILFDAVNSAESTTAE